MRIAKLPKDWLPILTALYSLLIALAGVLASAPFLSRIRELLPWLVLSALFVSIVTAVRRSHRVRAVIGVVAAFTVSLSAATTAEMLHADRRAVVLAAAAPEIEPISRHLLIGYRNVEELKTLLEHFDFAGVFVTARNAAGKSDVELASEIAELQAIQKRHGRLPLLVATDQEGGKVARLSGPLPWRASLAALDRGDVAEREAKAFALGEATAADLRSVGVNVNFAPVVDLRIADAALLDAHSRISERAIAADPETVARIAHAYTKGMTKAGVLPVAKHFPGLGRLQADTHVQDAFLATDARTLAATDWLPFRTLAQAHASAMMVGHAIATDIDATRPASTSPTLVNGVLRAQLGHEGLVFSDDLCMAPTYRRGVSASAKASLYAGVDVLLVTYDIDVVYEILADLRGTKAPNDERLATARRALIPTAIASAR